MTATVAPGAGDAGIQWSLPACDEGKHPRRDAAHFLHEPFQFTVVLDPARSDLFERRRLLMDDWAEHLAGERRPERSTPLAPSPGRTLRVGSAIAS